MSLISRNRTALLFRHAAPDVACLRPVVAQPLPGRHRRYAARDGPLELPGRHLPAQSRDVSAAASSKELSGTLSSVKLLGGIEVSETVFLGMEVAVLLAQLMLVDAAFSGDWSRIGVITHDTELLLQKICYFILVAHSITGLVSANMAGSRGLSPVVIGFKGFIFGTMEIWRVNQLPEASSSSEASSKTNNKRKTR